MAVAKNARMAIIWKRIPLIASERSAPWPRSIVLSILVMVLAKVVVPIALDNKTYVNLFLRLLKIVSII